MISIRTLTLGALLLMSACKPRRESTVNEAAAGAPQVATFDAFGMKVPIRDTNGEQGLTEIGLYATEADLQTALAGDPSSDTDVSGLALTGDDSIVRDGIRYNYVATFNAPNIESALDACERIAATPGTACGLRAVGRSGAYRCYADGQCNLANGRGNGGGAEPTAQQGANGAKGIYVEGEYFRWVARVEGGYGANRLNVAQDRCRAAAGRGTTYINGYPPTYDCYVSAPVPQNRPQAPASSQAKPSNATPPPQQPQGGLQVGDLVPLKQLIQKDPNGK